MAQDFNVFAVVQGGRLSYEAVIFTATFFHCNPGFSGRLILGEPEPGAPWKSDPRIANPALRRLLLDLGAEIRPFRNDLFGSRYPQGNKIVGLNCLPEDTPFVFFDTDTVFCGPLSEVPFDFDRPQGSMAREGTWPQPDLYGPGYHEIWSSLYERFGLDIAPTIDAAQPAEYWKRYLYFNAGFFFYRDPVAFSNWYARYASAIEDDPPEAISTQKLYPWLDQIALPLVIARLGGGRDTIPPGLIDGSITRHYRFLPLLYATAPDAVLDVLEAAVAPNPVKKILKTWEPARKLIYQGKGRDKVRPLFDRAHLPRREQIIRQRIKKAGWWLR